MFVTWLDDATCSVPKEGAGVDAIAGAAVFSERELRWDDLSLEDAMVSHWVENGYYREEIGRVVSSC